MTQRSMDGVRPKRRSPRGVKPKTSYPDLTPWLNEKEQVSAKPETVPIKINTKSGPSSNSSQPKQVASNAKMAREKRFGFRNIWRLSFSGFGIVTVMFAVLIGSLVIFQSGLASKDALLSNVTEASERLLSGSSALSENNLERAMDDYELAGAAFGTVQKDIESLSTVLKGSSRLLPGDPVASANNLLEAGVHLSAAGVSIAETLGYFNGLELDNFALDQQSVNSADVQGEHDDELVRALRAAEKSFDNVMTEVSAAVKNIERVEFRLLPKSIREKVEPVLVQLPALTKDLEKIDGLLGVVANIMGADEARYYVVMLQNPRELRPTGGFAGQFALVKVQSGRVEDIRVKSIYDADGQVTENIQAPDGLSVISETWSLRDANWSPDFPTSAESILSFFRETGDPKLDGVIALTPSVIENVLDLIGPVELPELDLSIDSDNFTEEAQYEVPNKDPDREEKFFPQFTQGLLNGVFATNQPDWASQMSILLNSVGSKDFLAYFVDPQEQALVEALEAAGALSQSSDDFLAVVESNIGGGKTDHFIEEERALEVLIGEQTVRHTLQLTRRDTRTNEFKHLENRHYLRFYVPAGSTLVSADGFDTDNKELLAYNCMGCDLPVTGTGVSWHEPSQTSISEDLGFDVYSNWLSLLPGDEKTVTITYETPLAKLSRGGNQLKMVLWKQPGAAEIPVVIRIKTEGERNILYSSDLAQLSGQEVLGEIMLARDEITGILFE